LAGQVEDSVKEARNADLLEVINAHARARHAELVGQEVEILCEGVSKHNPQRLSGRTRGNKIVVFTGEPQLAGRLLKVRVVHSSGFTLYGEYDGDRSGGAPSVREEAAAAVAFLS
jgi:tRNA-2-methylthio-N6-dimethylallyladenosine synthase